MLLVLGIQIGTGRKNIFNQIILIEEEISKHFMSSVFLPSINMMKQNEIVKVFSLSSVSSYC